MEWCWVENRHTCVDYYGDLGFFYREFVGVVSLSAGRVRRRLNATTERKLEVRYIARYDLLNCVVVRGIRAYDS